MDSIRVGYIDSIKVGYIVRGLLLFRGGEVKLTVKNKLY